MRLIWLIVLLFHVSCSDSATSVSRVKDSGNEIGQFRGIAVLNQTIKKRFVSPTQPAFFIGIYYGEKDLNPGSLSSLLGSFSGAGGSQAFTNGDPNAVNMLLLKIAMIGLSNDVAAISAGKTPQLKLNDDLLKLLKPIASDWPKASVRNEATLQQIWFAVMGFEPPEEEYAAWRDFFLNESGPYAKVSGEDAVRALTLTLLLNPYFILQT